MSEVLIGMGAITNLIFIVGAGLVATDSLEAQIMQYNNPQAPTGFNNTQKNSKVINNLQVFLNTNNISTDGMSDKLEWSSFGYFLKKDVLKYGKPIVSTKGIVGWHALGYNSELMKQVEVVYYPVVTEESFQKYPVVNGLVPYNNQEFLMVSLGSAGTKMGNRYGIIYIYDGVVGGVDGNVDVVEVTNENNRLVVIYDRNSNFNDSSMIPINEMNDYFKTIVEGTILADKVLDVFGLPR